MDAGESRDAGPWYRQLWPWLIIAPPAATVVGAFVTLGLALRYPEHDVRDGHYREGLGVYRPVTSASRAAVTDWSADLVLQSDGRVEVTVIGVVASGDVTLRFVHPTRATDQREVPLADLGGGKFEGRLPPPLPVLWNAVLVDDRNGWELAGVVASTGEPVRLAGSDHDAAGLRR